MLEGSSAARRCPSLSILRGEAQGPPDPNLTTARSCRPLWGLPDQSAGLLHVEVVFIECQGVLAMRPHIVGKQQLERVQRAGGWVRPFPLAPCIPTRGPSFRKEEHSGKAADSRPEKGHQDRDCRICGMATTCTLGCVGQSGQNLGPACVVHPQLDFRVLGLHCPEHVQG